MPDVKCIVDTCTHYLPGNICAANSIDILNEIPGKMSRNAEQTECKTFHHRKGIGVTDYLGSIDNVNWDGMVTAPFKDGQQLKPKVTCVVDSCKYWVDGDECKADAIEVTGDDADECQDTNCITFEDRDL